MPREISDGEEAAVNFTPPTLDRRNLMSDVPATLMQIIAVANRCLRGMPRTIATRSAAKDFGVDRTTVHDKYIRRMGWTAKQADRLLKPDKVNELRLLLLSRFPEHAQYIDRQFFPLSPRSAASAC